MNPAALRLWSRSLRFAGAGCGQRLAVACAIALSIAPASARAEEKLPLLGAGAVETAQLSHRTGGDPSEPVQSESAGQPKPAVGASVGPETSTPSNPEPHTWALMGAGLLAAAMIRRRMERRR